MERHNLLDGEVWWGGTSALGFSMPWRTEGRLELRGTSHVNQCAPFFVSSAGRYLWSDEPFAIEFAKDEMRVDGQGPFHVSEPLGSLREGFRSASARFFPPAGRVPDPLLFSAPQYNTWIELLHDQRQQPILDYAQALLDHGFPPGVLMIDAQWSRCFGDWNFAADRFPDPRGMIDRLHRWGFKVMLWVAPFITADQPIFRALKKADALVRDARGRVAIREWWDGFSALVDLTGGAGREWFRGELQRLHRDYGVDGFKLDGGESDYYRDDDRTAVPMSPNEHTEAFARVGLDWPLNELRVCWKCAGQPLVQRLCDKQHSWEEHGLRGLVPNTLVQGLMGHAFACPDMIGGGEYLNFTAQSDRLDQELFVRFAQASALLPMMQFSAAPWRVLDARHRDLCREAARLHVRFSREILERADHAAATGEPIARALDYVAPGCGYESVSDQFLLGDNWLVAPVLEKGATTRRVHVPPGTWREEETGNAYIGPTTIEVAVTLDSLPRFRREKGSG